MTGITTIPRTHNGEGLAYISPGEAAWLRQMGGGVPTDPQTGQRNQSQQLLGPGNIPSFVVGGTTAPGFGGGNVGGYSPSQGQGLGVQGVFSGTGSTTPGGGWMSAGGKKTAQAFLDASRSNPPSQHYGGPPNVVQRQIQQGVGAAPAVAELVDEEEPNVPTPEEIAERAAKLDAAIRRGAERLRAIHASLGYGPVGPRYGETSDGTQLFPGSTPVAIDQIPAWRGLLGSPAGPAIQVGLEQTQPTGGTPQGLLERVQLIANSLRPVEEAATGGEVRNYDLGGLVNSMLLQAARSRDNIPTNMVS